MKPMSSDAPPSGPDAGFTLLDLLVAMAIFSLTMVLLLRALSQVQQAIDVAERSTERASSTAVRTALEVVVGQTRPAVKADNEGPIFVGQRTEVWFVTGYATQGQYGGLYATHLFLTPGSAEDMSNLVLSQKMYPIGRDVSGRAAHEPILLHRVKALIFGYYGRQQETSPNGWFETWTATNRLPSQISIRVVFPEGDRREWPPMILKIPLAN